jgi:hypothetical protein
MDRTKNSTVPVVFSGVWSDASRIRPQNVATEEGDRVASSFPITQ